MALPLPEPTPLALEERSLPAEMATYVVRPGDCLWTIAGKETVLGDSFYWPLLYRENRDIIADPDLIEPKQSLSYRKEYSSAEISKAVKAAQDMQPYVRHSEAIRRQIIKD
jgi:hypothetical protein